MRSVLFITCLLLCISVFYSCSDSKGKSTSTIRVADLGSKANPPSQDSDETAGRLDVNIQINNLVRTAIIHIPKLDKSNLEKALPVVFVFHGIRGNASKFYKESGWTELAESEKFLAVYPNAYSTSKDQKKVVWNNGDPDQFTKENSPDDVKFFKQFLTYLDSNFVLDKNRIYLTGLADGAGMVYTLAANSPELIAAIGPVAGRYYGDNDPAESKMPVSCINIQGLEDPLLLWDWPNPKPNADAILSSKNGTSMKNFLSKFGFNTQYEIMEGVDNVYTFKYAHPITDAEFIYMMVINMKHAYPGSINLDESRHGQGAIDINAAGLFWEFFKTHPKPELM